MDSITVTIRGQEYQCLEIGDLELFPLLSVLEPPPNVSETSPEYQAWKERLAGRLKNSRNHRDVAYFIKSIFPDIPNNIVKCQFRTLSDGTEVCEAGKDIIFKLSSSELLEILEAIKPMLEKITKEAQQTQEQIEIQYSKPKRKLASKVIR